MPGKGKTTLASKFPKPLFFALERGIPRGVEATAVGGVDSFGGVMNTLTEIWQNGAEGFQTIVVDTLDALEAHVVEHTCAKHQWKSIETPPYGKGWVACEEEW